MVGKSVYLGTGQQASRRLEEGNGRRLPQHGPPELEGGVMQATNLIAVVDGLATLHK